MNWVEDDDDEPHGSYSPAPFAGFAHPDDSDGEDVDGADPDQPLFGGANEDLDGFVEVVAGDAEGNEDDDEDDGADQPALPTDALNVAAEIAGLPADSESEDERDDIPPAGGEYDALFTFETGPPQRGRHDRFREQNYCGSSIR